MPRIFMIAAVILAFIGSVEGAETIPLKTGSGVIYGTIETPKEMRPGVVVLIISGSGPTDRDGNIASLGKNNSLKMLAEGLAARGIPSLRYDKRGIGASATAGPREEELRFETYIEDAESWGRLLLQDQRFTQLIVVGHSEGALIGAVACRKLGARGFISIAGASQPAFQLLETQLKKNLPPAQLSESNTILDHLKKGALTDKVSPPLMPLFRPSVQPYLISWFSYDPVDELGRIAVPVLIVQGTTDIQVTTSDAERLSKANRHARVLLIAGMNHVLKSVPDDTALQIKSYSDPELPISPRLVDCMAAFIKELNNKE